MFLNFNPVDVVSAFQKITQHIPAHLKSLIRLPPQTFTVVVFVVGTFLRAYGRRKTTSCKPRAIGEAISALLQQRVAIAVGTQHSRSWPLLQHCRQTVAAGCVLRGKMKVTGDEETRYAIGCKPQTNFRDHQAFIRITRCSVRSDLLSVHPFFPF